jgi:hypothetical protein
MTSVICGEIASQHEGDCDGSAPSPLSPTLPRTHNCTPPQLGTTQGRAVVMMRRSSAHRGMVAACMCALMSVHVNGLLVDQVSHESACIRMTNPTHTQRPHPFSCLHMPSFATLGTHPYSRDALSSSAQQYVGWLTCLRRCAAVRGM